MCVCMYVCMYNIFVISVCVVGWYSGFVEKMLIILAMPMLDLLLLLYVPMEIFSLSKLMVQSVCWFLRIYGYFSLKVPAK